MINENCNLYVKRKIINNRRLRSSTVFTHRTPSQVNKIESKYIDDIFVHGQIISIYTFINITICKSH